MSIRKREWLDAALAYLAEHGVANLSLRPMAATLGTSPRILMFHFKSKDGLLQEALEELHARLQASFLSMVSDDPGPRRVAPLKRFWQWATSPQNLPYLRLLYEVQIIAVQNPAEYGRYLKKASAAWQANSLQALSASIRTRPMATLCVAVFDGLFLELMSTGDQRRLTRALDHFITMASTAIQASDAGTTGAKS
jgi:AcrR family transcriptional regulator